MKYKFLIAISAGVFALIFGLDFSSRLLQRPPACYAMTDGPSLDWENIETDAEFEACLLIVLKELQTPMHMAKWLQSQGFDATEPYDPTGAGEKTMVGASWIKSNNSSVFPYGTWDDRLKERIMMFLRSAIPYPIFPSFLPPGSYQINIEYFKDGAVDVDAGPNFL